MLKNWNIDFLNTWNWQFLSKSSDPPFRRTRRYGCDPLKYLKSLKSDPARKLHQVCLSASEPEVARQGVKTTFIFLVVFVNFYMSFICWQLVFFSCILLTCFKRKQAVNYEKYIALTLLKSPFAIFLIVTAHHHHRNYVTQPLITNITLKALGSKGGRDPRPPRPPRLLRLNSQRLDLLSHLKSPSS